MAKNKQEKNENIELCNGVWLTNSFFEKKENRIFTLLLKGFLVYLLTMGSIGFYLSSFNIAYNFLLVNAVIFVTAFLCAGLFSAIFIPLRNKLKKGQEVTDQTEWDNHA